MTKANAQTLGRELDWLDALIADAIARYFELPDRPPASALEPPDLDDDSSDYARLIKSRELGFDVRAILILAAATVLRPEALDPLLVRNKTLDKPFTEFGGVTHPGSGLLPTLDTVFFLLAGRDLEKRFEVSRHFGSMAPLLRGQLILPEIADAAASNERVLTPGPGLQPILGALAPPVRLNLPAQPLETRLEWADLVVPTATKNALEEIVVWMNYRMVMQSDQNPYRLFGPGYRSLFYGPPGTGKTLSAALLGKRLGRPVYRADLSTLVSKWIGETEKNLARLFDQAEQTDAILFFDEADALFAQRTAVKSAVDRYANQEVAYILQRIEMFEGLVLLATNLRSNIDPAFARRIQSTISFPAPEEAERLALWHRALAGSDLLGDDLDLPELARNYSVTGAGIVNVLRNAALTVHAKGRTSLTKDDLVTAIEREFRSETRAVERIR
ncbi:ATP-binding protein [uncultured Ruegeria sp.]|uniref:ATP-binding protein n=1 Tax=uncultured Ruegeria sp. TaxID=259304 RepID=UPI0026321721|nr:ATP-binding protein [uncultured Ruegeria sp.]